MTTYTGSCHCGAITFEADADLSETITCNCSHCSKKGFILTFVPKDHFRVLSGIDKLASYHFNKKVIDHQFCTTCGVQPFGKSDSMGQVAVNVRCLDGVDPTTLKPQPYNGKDV